MKLQWGVEAAVELARVSVSQARSLLKPTPTNTILAKSCRRRIVTKKQKEEKKEEKKEDSRRVDCRELEWRILVARHTHVGMQTQRILNDI